MYMDNLSGAMASYSYNSTSVSCSYYEVLYYMLQPAVSCVGKLSIYSLNQTI